MESTLKRPAVDVGPPRARPGIALVLALLSLPGSTIARRQVVTLLRCRTTLIAAVGLTVFLSTASAASATFPGTNGPIVFREDTLEGFGAPLFRAQPDGTQVAEINGRPGLFTDWRADGRRIAFDFFRRNGSEQIATMRPDGSDVRVITSGRGIHEVPSWSPSGRRIVFDFSRDLPDAPDFETRLWTIRANGSHAGRLPMRSRGFDVEPRYSPDGRRIAFMRLRLEPEFRQAIFTVNTKTHRVHRLTPWRLNSDHPTWSPDSRWILFNNSPDGTIQVMRPSGDERRTIVPASEGFGGHKPWFSPDGSQVLFMCENQGTLNRPPPDYSQDICVMNADGSNIVKVIDTPDTFENWPSWGPAGCEDHRPDPGAGSLFRRFRNRSATRPQAGEPATHRPDSHLEPRTAVREGGSVLVPRHDRW